MHKISHIGGLASNGKQLLVVLANLVYSRVCLQTSSEGMKFLKSFLLGKICTLVFCEHFDV